MSDRRYENILHLRSFLAGTGCFLALFIAIASTASFAADKPQLTWLVPNLPPAYIVDPENTASGSGYIDLAEQYFHDRMPGFSHRRVEATFKRATQAMSSKDGYCHSGLLYTPDRAKAFLLSRPAYIQLGIGLLTDRNRAALVQPYIDDQGQLDLDKYMHGPINRLNLVKGRSYTTDLDTILYEHDHGLRYASTSKQALDIFAGGRDADILEYPIIAEYHLRQYGSKRNWIYYPISGIRNYLRIFFGCSNGPVGQKAMRKINAIISETGLDGTAPWQLHYLEWLGPEASDQYRQIHDRDGPLRRNLPTADE